LLLSCFSFFSEFIYRNVNLDAAFGSDCLP